jgi:type VI protein secretion system component VasK
MRDSSLLRGVGVVALTLALVECGYRLVFWYFMSISEPGQAHLNAKHLHIWLGVAVVAGVAWLYLAWGLIQEERASRKKKAAKKKKTKV